MKTKKILIILFGILMLIIPISNKSYAKIQSNDETDVANKSIPVWMEEIRQMEQLGGGLGLEETIGDKLLSNNGVNNLDCHMQKNTEYGGLVILSASSYGNPEKVENGQTTTGNASGVVMNINGEWTAAGTMSSVGVYANAQTRYKSVYASDNYVAKDGDAITETEGWHGSTDNTWIHNTGGISGNSTTGLLRAYKGSIFSYYGYGANYWYSGSGQGWIPHPAYDAFYSKLHPCRAVIVVGKGF